MNDVGVRDFILRDIAPDEIAFYRKTGWVKLENILSVSLAEQLLEVAQAEMGSEAEDPRFDNRASSYSAWANCSGEDSWIYSISHSRALSRIASQLTGGRPLRWYTDHFFAKRPVQSGGRRTRWHQDLPHQAFDRGGALSLWAPLVDCPPEKGTMRFLSGSHRAGPLGRYAARSDGADIIDHYPQLLDEYEISPPLHLKAGDVTIHDFLTIHSAPDNLTDSTRWIYGVTWFPADTLYNGAASIYTKGMQVDQTFDDARFPILEI